MNRRALAAAVGARLTASRYALGLTVAEICRRAGCSPSAYRRWERGAALPSIRSAIALCSLGLTLEWIYRGNPSRLTVGRAKGARVAILPVGRATRATWATA